MKKILLAGAAAVALSAASAQAVEINGTFTAGIGLDAVAGSVTNGTVLVPTGGVVTARAGDFAPFLTAFLTPLTNISNITLSAGSTFSFDLGTVGSFSGSVMAGTVAIGGPANGRTYSAYIIGSFTPAGAMGGFDVSPASVTISGTQTNPGTEPSISFSFAAPPTPPPGVPAPMSLALFGMGLAGLGLIARRKAS